jgi:hypothetical protein
MVQQPSQQSLPRQASQPANDFDFFSAPPPQQPQQPQMSNSMLMAQYNMNQQGSVSQPMMQQQRSMSSSSYQQQQQMMTGYRPNPMMTGMQPFQQQQPQMTPMVTGTNYQYRPSIQQSYSAPNMPMQQPQQMYQQQPQQPMFGAPANYAQFNQPRPGTASSYTSNQDSLL